MFDLQWSILNLAEFKAEMFSRYNLSEPPLEGTTDYWIMIDMNGFTAKWYEWVFSLCMMAIRIQFIRAYLPPMKIHCQGQNAHPWALCPNQKAFCPNYIWGKTPTQICFILPTLDSLNNTG